MGGGGGGGGVDDRVNLGRGGCGVVCGASAASAASSSYQVGEGGEAGGEGRGDGSLLGFDRVGEMGVAMWMGSGAEGSGGVRGGRGLCTSSACRGDGDAGGGWFIIKWGGQVPSCLWVSGWGGWLGGDAGVKSLGVWEHAA